MDRFMFLLKTHPPVRKQKGKNVLGEGSGQWPQVLQSGKGTWLTVTQKTGPRGAVHAIPHPPELCFPEPKAKSGLKLGETPFPAPKRLSALQATALLATALQATVLLAMACDWLCNVSFHFSPPHPA